MRLLFLWSLLLSPPLAALGNAPGSSAAEFLRLGAGARALGMGEAFSAVAEGPEAVYWNPAGLAELHRPAFGYTHAELSAGLRHDYAAAAFPVPIVRGGLALALTRLSQDPIGEVDASNQSRGSFSPHSEALSLAYGRQVLSSNSTRAPRDYFRDQWNLPTIDQSLIEERQSWEGTLTGGAAIQFVQEDLGTRKASTFALDGGVMFRPGELHALTLAAAARHLGGRLRFIAESEPLPAEIALAGAYEVRAGQWGLLSSLEADAPYSGTVYGKFGIEATHPVSQSLSAAARFGFNSRPVADLGILAGIAAGVGVRAGGFSFDAAFQPLAVLGETFRFSVGWRF